MALVVLLVIVAEGDQEAVASTATARSGCRGRRLGCGLAVRLAGPGRFAAWCARRPASLRAGRKDVPFAWDPATGLLLADIPGAADSSPSLSVVVP